MSIISLLSIICICIEIWHIVFFCFLYEKYFKNTDIVIKWAEEYDKFNKHFINFRNYYVNNPELQHVLCNHLNPSILELFNEPNIDEDIAGIHKIFNICPIRHLIRFSLLQVIEFIYWGIVLVLFIIMPNVSGIILTSALIIISMLEKKFNKNKDKAIIILDSKVCILMFAITAFMFY